MNGRCVGSFGSKWGKYLVDSLNDGIIFPSLNILYLFEG